MADFATAYAKTMKHEGGYAHNKDDRGGETYKGIARRHWPGWKGWEIVDALKSKPGFPQNLAGNELLQAHVESFYKRNFWSGWYDQMDSQELAERVFDRAVNCGVRQAHKMLQRAAGVADDGVFGYGTLNAVNSAGPELIERFREESKAFYTALAERDSSQKQFLKGWHSRC